MSPMLLTDTGILTLFRLWQCSKAFQPMLFTVLGMTMLFRLLHHENRLPSMLLTGQLSTALSSASQL